ncbi:MAG: hypothetical protein DRJ47_11465, partial [Thermoprotei archaeon]
MAYKESIDLETAKAQASVEKLAQSAGRLAKEFSAAQAQAMRMSNRRLHEGLRRVTSEIALMRKESARLSRSQIGVMQSVLNVTRALQEATTKGKKQNRQLSRWQRFLRNVRREMGKTQRATKKFSGVVDMWWKRFGQVAIAFTIVYRAMNAVETALGHLSETMLESIKLSGELASTQAKLAMWTVMLSKGTVSFDEAFKRAGGNVAELSKVAAVSLSTFEELVVAMDEFVQAGLIVPKKLIPAMASLTDFIKMIALTTGSSVRQIRQEIQALMEGQVKATNVLIRTAVRMGWISDKELQDLKAMRG